MRHSPTRPPGAAAERRALALKRGRIVHRLMQSLPDMPPERRVEAMARYLARAKDVGAAERDGISQQVLAVLDDPRFAPLFAGGRAEVPVVGRITRPGGPPLAVSGQVDRLAITPDAVLIADYKTNSPAPQRIEDVPDGYVTQLALYRAVLRMIYPDRPVRAALLWTDGPELMEVPGGLAGRGALTGHLRVTLTLTASSAVHRFDRFEPQLLRFEMRYGHGRG